MTRVQIPEKMEIHLTDAENEICALLDGCTKWMKERHGVETSCRIAGGWVRDKLLGLQSNDIDIALEQMMGLPFAEEFQAYCGSVMNIPIEKIAKVERNPDRSKHLETAKATVLDIELDFVNLRSEEYADDSRIPTQVAFGTPLQDALRRDMTINALFYNVHSREVEDHTQKGLSDLKDGIIRTPLSPKETFMDDPLRVIRCVRFASRFGFELVPELQEAARDAEIQHALRAKISRERVGEELDKMMKGRNPLHAIELINDLRLYTSIFYIPPHVAPELSAPLGSPKLGLAAAYILETLTLPEKQPSTNLPALHPLLAAAATYESSTRPRLYLACALTPYRGLTYDDIKNKCHLAVEAAIRNGTKLGAQNHYLDGIPVLFTAAEMLKNPVIGGEDERVRIGLLLRNKNVHNTHTGSYWATSLLFSLVQELTSFWDTSCKSLDIAFAASRIEAYNTFVRRIEELGLPAMVDAKPLLGGNEVVRVLDTGRSGPWMNGVLARITEWQLRHPEGTKAQCEEWLRSEHAAGRISFDVAPVKRVNIDGGEKQEKKLRK
ncbi:uncharacterized protein PHACADRAFT_110357 [Phanerochaete carnosa HHB-10118-sp]|uniref:Poly A polymerase head domain-containing protein n=1 Tax=Phanerochaete carnosa (strain HHB-10118-sp) TaxID=650164 RepID=K5WNC0_PHACS|nr:uncharacterized protein PHACADRAFT_110357 [Phanerochaete carnosa HHB-10118-sp]EKM60714.1 hypothetical protein PHACADRAFT_110357 [Phanerochaete carnosa HHB-10118-sp]